MTHVVLLRAINLGARNRVAMPRLREVLEGAGMSDVRTYLQSGNVLLCSRSSGDQLARDCERRIADGLGLQIDVVVRTRAELARIVRKNPLAGVATDPKLYQVSFCSRAPNRALVDTVAGYAVAPEQVRSLGRELYAWYPHGVARSKLAVQLGKRGLGVTATARNWKTVTKLLELAAE